MSGNPPPPPPMPDNWKSVERALTWAIHQTDGAVKEVLEGVLAYIKQEHPEE